MKKIMITCALLVTMPAMAQETPFDTANGEAWQVVYRIVGELMNEDIASRLSMIAYHEVAGEICDGVQTDSAKIKQAVIDLRPVNYLDLSDEDRLRWNSTFLTNFGIMFGVMLDQNIEHKDAFCAGVVESIADEENDWHLFETGDTASESD